MLSGNPLKCSKCKDATINERKWKTMIKILFVCHGNICRSPMCEFFMKKLVAEQGLSDEFFIASAATSTEEIWNGIGNPVYPPAAYVLRLRQVRLSHRHGQRQHPQHAPDAGRRPGGEDPQAPVFRRLGAGHLRPLVHRRLRRNLPGCNGRLRGTPCTFAAAVSGFTSKPLKNLPP